MMFLISLANYPVEISLVLFIFRVKTIYPGLYYQFMQTVHTKLLLFHIEDTVIPRPDSFKERNQKKENKIVSKIRYYLDRVNQFPFNGYRIHATGLLLILLLLR